MPAVGDQHRVGQLSGNIPKPVTEASVVANPFEERTPHMSEYTAKQIATLQSRLDKQLGPEYISSRPGAGGQKVHYLAAEKCINLANEVFGFNGWSSAIQNIQHDFIDEHPNTGKVSLGLSVIVRVSLRDGTYHEDIGYGHIENCKGKAAAFEKAKKEGTTDALKRALRNFGNVLGNCIYDKDYLAKVTKIKAGPSKWDVENLHRHPDYAPVKKEPPPLPPQPVETKPNVVHSEPKNVEPQLPEMPSKTSTNETPIPDPDCEFGSDVFDEADFVEPSIGNPDEIILETDTRQTAQAPFPQHGLQSNHPNGSLRNPPDTTPSKPERTWVGNRPTPIPQNNVPAQRTNIPPGNPQPAKQIPATPTAVPPKPPNHNQQSRPSQDPPQPAPLTKATEGSDPMAGNNATADGNPNHPGGPQFADIKLPEDANVGFFSARAAEALKTNPTALKTAPQFDPRADSPSIRKTAGFNHNQSAPVLRKAITTTPSAITTAAGANAAQTNSPLPGREGSNPPTDFGRRVGAPGGFSPVTRAQTSSYRPPARKTANSGTGNAASPGPGVATTNNTNGKRSPLDDTTNVPATSGPMSGTGDPMNPKRAKIEGGTHGNPQHGQQASNHHQQQQQNHHTGVR